MARSKAIVDKSQELLQILRGKASAAGGLMIVKADTTTSFVFEGSSTPLDLDLFEVPKSLQPIAVGKRYFTLPIVAVDNSQRWGIIQILD